MDQYYMIYWSAALICSSGVLPVSYTHLDVYKRQAADKWGIKEFTLLTYYTQFDKLQLTSWLEFFFRVREKHFLHQKIRGFLNRAKQACDLNCARAPSFRLVENIKKENIFWWGLKTVSYTHLDVYKRQGLGAPQM